MKHDFLVPTHDVSDQLPKGFVVDEVEILLCDVSIPWRLAIASPAAASLAQASAALAEHLPRPSALFMIPTQSRSQILADVTLRPSPNVLPNKLPT